MSAVNETSAELLLLLSLEEESLCDVRGCARSGEWWVICRDCDAYIHSWCDPHVQEVSEDIARVDAAMRRRPLRLLCGVCRVERPALYRYERRAG